MPRVAHLEHSRGQRHRPATGQSHCERESCNCNFQAMLSALMEHYAFCGSEFFGALTERGDTAGSSIVL